MIDVPIVMWGTSSLELTYRQSNVRDGDVVSSTTLITALNWAFTVTIGHFQYSICSFYSYCSSTSLVRRLFDALMQR